jgi:positive regulator of sigma E activity
MMLRANNTVGARIGDTVVVGIDRKVRVRGYLLAYIIPLVSFVAGALIGHVAGEYLGTPAVDVPAGFLALTVASFYTFLMLRRLDRTFMLNITRVVADCVFEVDLKTDEERRFEGHLVTR